MQSKGCSLKRKHLPVGIFATTVKQGSHIRDFSLVILVVMQSKVCFFKLIYIPVGIFATTLKQGSHIHDFQQDFNKTKTHAVKCEEQVAVLQSEVTEPYTRLH